MSSSNAPTGVLRRRTCLAHCQRLLGKEADALHPTPRTDKRSKPETLLYDDWVIQNGERVKNANFPSPLELCDKRMLDYSNRKLGTKCSKLGRRSMGAPAPHGQLEFPLRREERCHVPDDHPSRNPTKCFRHPAAKSVKIEGISRAPARRRGVVLRNTRYLAVDRIRNPLLRPLNPAAPGLKEPMFCPTNPRVLIRCARLPPLSRHRRNGLLRRRRDSMLTISMTNRP